MDPRRLKWLLWIGAIGILFFIAVAAASAFLLPAYVQSRLIPSVTRGWGLEPREVRVRRIGLWGADLGPIVYAAGETPVFTVAAVQIDYSPLSLMRGRISGITLGGVHLALEAGDKGVTIPGLVLPERQPAAEKTAAPGEFQGVLPIGLNRFRLSRSEVVLMWQGRRYLIPMDMTLDTSRLQDGVLAADARVEILGNPISVAARLDLKANSAQANIIASGAALGSFVLTGQLPEQVRLAGVADLEAEARIQLQPFTWNAAVNSRIREFRLEAPNVSLANTADQQSTELPVKANLEADSDTGMRWSCGPLQLRTPVSTQIEHLRGHLQPSEDGWQANAEMTTRTMPQDLGPLVGLTRELTIQWEAQAGPSDQGAIGFKVDAATDQPLALKNELIQLTHGDARMAVKGLYGDGTLTADTTVTLKQLLLRLADGKVNVPEPVFNSRLVIRPPTAAAGSEFTMDIDLPNITSTFGSSSIGFPKMKVQASGQSSPGAPWQVKANVSAINGRAIEKKSALRLQGIDLSLPLQWPPAGRGKAGGVRVATIQLAKRQLGDLKGTLRQVAAGLDMDLRHQSKLFAGLTVLVNGGMKASGIQLEAKLPVYDIPDGTDLGQFMPAASGLEIAGRVQARGRLALQLGSIQSEGFLKLDQGSLQDVVRGINLDGIHTEIALEDVIDIRSKPQQKLRVEHLRFGNLSAEALAMAFQLEPGRTLFIEKASLDWCNGQVNTAAIRIVPDKDDYDVTLSCDRLNLAMLLEQLGAAEASGEGSVNGRIPLRWADGRLSFDNGFLYSTPGQTGAIQIKGTEVLLTGLPPGTPQHTQLDIATEALKDYTYKWAKLALNSDDENLLLKLQFDGKPNRLMPFAYDKSLGQFKRIAGEGQADFKGISIDLNFTSPLNDIIHYKDFLKQN